METSNSFMNDGCTGGQESIKSAMVSQINLPPIVNKNSIILNNRGHMSNSTTTKRTSLTKIGDYRRSQN